MKIITQKSKYRLKIKKKRSDLIPTADASLAWELDFKGVDYVGN